MLDIGRLLPRTSLGHLVRLRRYRRRNCSGEAGCIMLIDRETPRRIRRPKLAFRESQCLLGIRSRTLSDMALATPTGSCSITTPGALINLSATAASAIETATSTVFPFWGGESRLPI
jgi:hypothetical protein